MLLGFGLQNLQQEGGVRKKTGLLRVRREWGVSRGVKGALQWVPGPAGLQLRPSRGTGSEIILGVLVNEHSDVQGCCSGHIGI